jgi:hypothetical protein
MFSVFFKVGGGLPYGISIAVRGCRGRSDLLQVRPMKRLALVAIVSKMKPQQFRNSVLWLRPVSRIDKALSNMLKLKA